MKSTIPVIVIIIMSFLPTGVVFATIPPDPCTDPDLPCPIDGGLSLLIAAGIGIGAKKAYDQKKKTASLKL